MSTVDRASRPQGHALVLGGSMAGLLAARALAEHFERVTLVERDPEPRNSEPRKGVPQGRHVHVLLARGQQIVTRYFPDLLATLPTEGLVGADTGAELQWHHFGCWKARFPSGLRMLFVYRPHLEAEVARRVLALPNVKLLAGHEVIALTPRADGLGIGGARLRGPDPGAALVEEPAALVVDATGRGSQAPRWLRELGFSAPEESEVEVNVGYTSRVYQAPAEPMPWKALFVVPRPPAKRAGAIFPISADRWLVTLAGWLADYPPADEDGLRAFARALPVPTVAEALERARPLTPPVAHRFPSSRRRHFERLRSPAEGLLVVGDGFCSFNPIYGQGMTAAAMHAEALSRELADRPAAAAGRDGLAAAFHRRVSRLTDVPWMLATGEDLRYAETRGRRHPSTSVVNWYVGRVHRAAARDPAVTQAFYRVLHLLSPPALLFRPDLPLRLLRDALRPGRDGVDRLLY